MKVDYSKRNFIWNAVGNITYLMCQWLITVLVPVLGNFEDAGVLSVAMSVSATCQTLAMFGIRNFQVSDVDGKYEDSCYVALRALTCGGAMAVCLIFSLCAGYGGGQFLAITLFMIFRLAETYSDVLHGIAQKNGRLYIGGISFFMKGIGLLICFFAGFKLTGSLNVGLLAMTVFSCASTVIYDLSRVRRLAVFRLTDSLKNCGRLALETLPLCVYLFLFSAVCTLPKLILESVSGEAVLGIYSSIYAPAMLLQAASGYLYTPFATHFATYRKDGKQAEFKRMLIKIAAVILALALLAVGAAIVLGEFALVLLFGEEIRPHVDLLIPILVVNFVSAYFGFFCMLAVVMRQFRWLLSGCFTGFLISILLTKPAIEWYGTNGTSYSIIFATVIACAILLVGILLAVRRIHSAGQNDERTNEGNEI